MGLLRYIHNREVLQVNKRFDSKVLCYVQTATKHSKMLLYL